MTISVGPERSTLSLPGTRSRTDEPTLRAGPNGLAAAASPPRSAAAVTVASSAVAEAGALRAQASGLDRASSITDTALAGADSVLSLLMQLRDAGPGERPARMVLDRIDETVRGAAFAGVNLLDGSLPGGLRLPANADGSGEVAVAAHDLRSGGPHVAIDADADAPTVTMQAEAALVRVEGARGQLHEDSRRLEAHRAFTGLLSDALSADTGGLDIEGARLAALSVKQALAGGTAPLAGGAPQAVLSLFR
jgi:flagellin